MLNKLKMLVDKKLMLDKDNQKLIYIKSLLEDDKIFFKISIEEAYSIFKDLDLDKNYYKDMYQELISSNNYS